jgi:ketosteroid isomerase-like protein
MTFDPTAEAEVLLRRDAEWAVLASAGADVDRVVSYWTDDAVVMPPGQPIVEGRSALRRFVSDSFAIPGFRIHWTSDSVQFSPDGCFAYMHSRNEMTVPGPDGALMTIRGRAVTIWRREADGHWRCAVDIWNDAPPPIA